MTGHMRGDARKRAAEDNHTRTEADAATHAAHLGRSEHIGNDIDDQEPNPLLATSLGPDPWLPFACPKCGDEDRAGMPEVCGCGWRNYG